MPARANEAPSADPATGPADATDSKERILAAALEAFAELGFDGATTREIAQRAGVNLGLIQYYFDGKENLWRAAVERAFSEIQAGLDAVLADDSELDERERARLMIRTFVEYVSAHPQFVHLMHDEGKRDGPRMRWLVDHYVRDFFERVTSLVRRTRPFGSEPEGLDLVSLHYALVGAVVLIFHQAGECRYLTGVDPTDERLVDAHVRTLERLLLLAPSSPSPSEISS